MKTLPRLSPCVAVAVRLVVLLGVTACQHRPVPASESVFPGAGAGRLSPMLILPPVLHRDMDRATAERLALALETRLTRVQGLQCVVIPPQQSPVHARGLDDLLAGGRLDLPELAAMGTLTECRTVLAVELLEASPYAPQRMTLRGVIVEAENAGVLASVSTHLDLGAEPCLQDFHAFLGGGRNRLLTRDSLEDTHRLHTAALSSEQFSRFAADRLLRQLFQSVE